jgi:hypothetical protein
LLALRQYGISADFGISGFEGGTCHLEQVRATQADVEVMVGVFDSEGKGLENGSFPKDVPGFLLVGGYCPLNGIIFKHRWEISPVSWGETQDSQLLDKCKRGRNVS